MVRSLLSLLLAVGLVAGTAAPLPHAGDAHGAGSAHAGRHLPAGPLPAHGAHHAAVTPGAGDCTHCPTPRCRVNVACATAPLTAVPAAAPALPEPSSRPAAPAAPPRSLHSVTAQPTTPPPQRA